MLLKITGIFKNITENKQNTYISLESVLLDVHVSRHY